MHIYQCHSTSSPTENRISNGRHSQSTKNVPQAQAQGWTDAPPAKEIAPYQPMHLVARQTVPVGPQKKTDLRTTGAVLRSRRCSTSSDAGRRQHTWSPELSGDRTHVS